MSYTFKKHKLLLAATLLTSVLFAITAVAAAFVLQYILDAVIYGNWELFWNMTWVTLIYIVVTGGFVFLNGICTHRLIKFCVRDMRQSLYNGILSRDAENFQSVNTADYISALSNDVKIIEENRIKPLLESFQYALIFILATVALFYYSPIIGGIMLLSLVFMYFIPASLGKPISRRQDLLSQSFVMFTVRLKDQLSGFDVIRSFQLTDRVRDDFTKRNNELANKKYSVDKMTVASGGISATLGAATQLFTMLVSGYLVLQGHMTPGILLAILQLSGAFTQPVAVIMQSIPMIQGTKSVIERITSISTESISNFQGKEEPVFNEDIRFKDVTFGYTAEKTVLDDMNVVIEKNKKYAIIGGSGSGKTTMARLMCANYSGYTGEITIDGRELHELDIDKLLAQISFIHQNVYMFDETIKANIDLQREYSDTEWQSALATSGVDRFLESMENGLDTEVGENGVNLSGGQRQRIAVARALIQKKPILILDEGTAAVDRQTAYDIETSLLSKPDITILTITHNLSPELLRKYDSILFLENGKIAEIGDYDRLINKQAGFSDFVQVSGRK